MKHVIPKDGYEMQIEAEVTFLMIIGAHISNLFVIEVKILLLIK